MLAAIFAAVPMAAGAAGTTAVVTGVVRASNGTPLAGAQVELIGPTRLSKTTDAQGKYLFPEVPTGLYTLQVTKAGYSAYRDDSVAAFIGETVTASITLAESSFSSLRTIASVSTHQPGVAQINTSTAAIDTISAATFEDQGSQQVTKVLNETPGIFTTPYNPNNGNPNNNASPGSIQTPQIRGALPYETESLIDGHPVSVGSEGTFSPTLINPFLLENVELVKGPGSMPAEINYAINGTVNYRTLEPTQANTFDGTISDDTWGGVSVGFKLTGETKNHKIGYAAGYVTDGAPGPLNNFQFDTSAIPLYGATGLAVGPTGNLSVYNVNTGAGNQVIGGLPIGEAGPPAAWAKYGLSETFAEPVVGCCFQSQTGYHSTSELAKLVFNFSNNTSLKLSYLGGQSMVGNGDSSGTYSTDNVAGTGLPFMYFAPCGSTQGVGNCYNGLTGVPYGGATYNCGSFTGPGCGSAIPFDLSSVNGMGYTWSQQNLFQGEFRTTLGNTGTVLARYYTGSLNGYTSEGEPAGTTLSYSMRTWGALPLCPVGDTYYNVATGCSGGSQPVMTVFNGQNVTFSSVGQGAYVSSNDTMSGETLEIQELLGENTLTLAYDRSQQSSSALTDEPSVGLVSNAPAPGSNQTFSTFSLRDSVMVRPKVLLDLGDYVINYASHFSPDGGVTWGDSSHAYNEPRAALSWHPNNDTAVRFSAGGSVAPPYMGLISGDASPSSWSYVIGGVPSLGFILNTNNGDLSSETAFSYDLGMDRRIARSTSVSADVYFTQLHNLFLPETSLLSTADATAAGCPAAGVYPCYISKEANLGQARYEGIELAVNHVPQYGFGWKVQGSLQRAFTYNLPQYFYCANPGPGCTNDINLGVIPETNFGGQPTGLLLGQNGVGSGRVPYASGYGELNWNGHYSQYYNVGVTYYGNNNPFNQPPFFIISANVRMNVGNHGTRLQLSADNLGGVYANPYPSYFNGIPLPLAKGATGPTGSIAFAPTPGGNYGPTTLRLILSQDLSGL
jgi:hypothetical protein